VLKNQFFPYWKIYNIERVYREKGDLRLYRFHSTDFKEEIKLDCKILKLIYDIYPDQTRLDQEDIVSLVEKAGISEERITNSLKRIFNLYHLHIPQPFKHIHQHNSKVEGAGFCPACRRVKSGLDKTLARRT